MGLGRKKNVTPPPPPLPTTLERLEGHFSCAKTAVVGYAESAGTKASELSSNASASIGSVIGMDIPEHTAGIAVVALFFSLAVVLLLRCLGSRKSKDNGTERTLVVEEFAPTGDATSSGRGLGDISVETVTLVGTSTTQKMSAELNASDTSGVQGLAEDMTGSLESAIEDATIKASAATDAVEKSVNEAIVGVKEVTDSAIAAPIASVSEVEAAPTMEPKIDAVVESPPSTSRDLAIPDETAAGVEAQENVTDALDGAQDVVANLQQGAQEASA
ncbi:unnamed protein product [Choristocarpus tenellus]